MISKDLVFLWKLFLFFGFQVLDKDALKSDPLVIASAPEKSDSAAVGAVDGGNGNGAPSAVPMIVTKQAKSLRKLTIEYVAQTFFSFQATLKPDKTSAIPEISYSSSDEDDFFDCDDEDDEGEDKEDGKPRDALKVTGTKL